MNKKKAGKTPAEGKTPQKSKKQVKLTALEKINKLKIPRLPGRPTKLTKTTLQKLELAFMIGCSDKEACIFAEIWPASLYEYQKKNKGYLERKKLLKDYSILQARTTVFSELDNVQTAAWYLERKKKDEFSAKVEAGFNEETLKFFAENLNLTRKLFNSVKPPNKPKK